jgi:hypothetical protein
VEWRDFHQSDFSEISCLGFLLTFVCVPVLVRIHQKQDTSKEELRTFKIYCAVCEVEAKVKGKLMIECYG